MIRHEPGDLVCCASADVGLAELGAELAKAGQMLALDPPGAGRLTLGEVFDGGLAGPRSHRYGEPRDLVLGMTVELADGTVARCGGRVVKNVAGYDLARLFTGAGGRLGTDPRAVAAPASAAGGHLHAGRRAGRPGAAGAAGAGLCGVQRDARSDAGAVREPGRRRAGGGRRSFWSAANWWTTTRSSGPSTGSGRLAWRRFAARRSRRCGRSTQLRAGGAATVVGRLARGWLWADPAAVAGAARQRQPDQRLALLEQRVLQAFSG